MSEPRYYLIGFKADTPRDHEQAVIDALRTRCGVDVQTYTFNAPRIADVLPTHPAAPIVLPHPIAQPQPVTTLPAPVVTRPAWADRDPVPATNGNGLKSYDSALQVWWLSNATSGAGVVDASGATGTIPAHAWKTKVGRTWYAAAARPVIIAQRQAALAKA